MSYFCYSFVVLLLCHSFLRFCSEIGEIDLAVLLLLYRRLIFVFYQLSCSEGFAARHRSSRQLMDAPLSQLAVKMCQQDDQMVDIGACPDQQMLCYPCGLYLVLFHRFVSLSTTLMTQSQ